jgi:hypothetical protein
MRGRRPFCARYLRQTISLYRRKKTAGKELRELLAATGSTEGHRSHRCLLRRARSATRPLARAGA